MENYFKEFLTGQSITLQQMTSSDLEAFAKIESEKKALLLTSDEIPFPNTFEDHASFFQSISGEKEEFIFGIFEKSSNELIGSCGVFSINRQNSTCLVGISIGEQWQAKGLGTDAMKTLIHFIFNYISVNKIKLDVFSFNKAAIRSYEKCGFTKEGILRNEILFGFLREEYRISR
ncbi:GNAT family N-acetyltransferase [Lysinibacillus agricola]|uniref:GNAT family N-acetyltransferase n=1 Tax=Lysinibacillus agricola TaxID=2590012 RepID=A0ABX7B060_9BACI|nr:MULTISPECIES: GNAT family protein [Lysinibacillus]KOS64434.1 acetyltransferase [Lysinibacillus sp. FJAT-14222]QQP14705.1 GNAT family N-acetyltransferase [Lysinibacillus agricola]